MSAGGQSAKCKGRPPTELLGVLEGVASAEKSREASGPAPALYSQRKLVLGRDRPSPRKRGVGP